MGRPVSYRALASVDSARTTPSSDTVTFRDVAKVSMRWYGSRGWTITRSSSSNHSSRSPHGTVT